MGGPRSSLPGSLLRVVGQRVSGPMLDEFRRQQAARNEPHARLLRRSRAVQRKLWLLLAVTVVFALVAVTAFTGAAVSVFSAVVGAVGALGSLAFAARTGAEVYGVHKRLALTPRTRALPPEQGYRLPPVGSKARGPMQRLAAAESGLSDLLEQLLPGSGVAPVSPESITSTRRAADEAAAELRRLAAQLRAVESARDASGKVQRGSLSEAIGTVRAKLDEGVEAYGGLVAAAGETVAASASPGSRQGLVDATDHLHGLAMALSELSWVPPEAAY